MSAFNNQPPPRLTVPSPGFGCGAVSSPEWIHDALLHALEAGYRHIDCAWVYATSPHVGTTLRKSGVRREDVFITSKFWPSFAAPELVEVCLDRELQALGTEYLDLWLAHWPLAVERDEGAKPLETKLGEDGKAVVQWGYCPRDVARRLGNGRDGSFLQTFRAMQECVRTGKVKAIGLSNFSIEMMEELLPHEADVPISCVQIEAHPWFPNRKLVDFCKAKGIVVGVYSPLGGIKMVGEMLGKSFVEDEKVVCVAERNGISAGQVLLSWAVQRGTVPITRSANPDRIKANLELVRLSAEDMAVLDGLEIPNQGGRGGDVSEVIFALPGSLLKDE